MARTKQVNAQNNGSQPSSSKSNGTGVEKARSPSPDASDRPLGPLSVTVPAYEREEVKVNNANLTELKNACDDAVKRFLSRPELFKQQYLHTDIRLALGWLSVFVAAGTAFYGYKVEFEQSKPVVTIGLVLYIILTTLSTLYAYFVEGDTIFVGKRKTFSKRIITERITLSSSSPPLPKNTSCPSYSVSLQYVRSTNGGKTLLGRGRTTGAAEYSRFFDEAGVMDQPGFEKWVGGLVESAMDGKAA
ncbi:hypothetical protein FA13DRAFT_1763311 [Coprinellus micaceus]|uniref:Signal peptidase complex subunit 2 n=1 Tax=Coprinellus micaceus TaxID=71717 RepID=A0A4Y7TK19_COPMI|nr:hypothetical protein FA13DRAFT_1763311 [Coprinellus micaceus]